jgi:hypothetical protein
VATVIRYSHLAGASGTATVPAGFVVSSIRAHATSAGTLVITPAGGSALPSIPLPAAAPWFAEEFDPEREELLPGTTLVFTSTDRYYVGLFEVGGV